MDASQIGLIGLGRMGCGLGGRLRRAGLSVTGFDPSPDARQEAAEADIDTVGSIEALVERIPHPRRIWCMVPAGHATESTMTRLSELLEPGDSVVEGGNSDYRDSVHRHELFASRGIAMLDVGTSGGILGSETGYSLMIGGSVADAGPWRPVFEALAPGPDRGWAHVGGAGAGHFTKMVHNAIEYGLMEAYAEGVALLRSEGTPEVDALEATRAWRHGSIISSTLMDLTASILDENALERVLPRVEDSGLGRLAVNTAVDRGVPLPVITQALIERIRSRDEQGFAARLLAAMRGRFGGHAVPGLDADAG
jgi:6-phosphogluconate dehydrogenase